MISSKQIKDTLFLWTFGITKVPLIMFCRPSVVELSENRVEIKIPLNYQTRNHLKSMYFGALAIGADCAGGLLAMYLLKKSKKNFSFVFKDMKAEFLKRADGDVHFVCNDGAKVQQFAAAVISSGERQNQEVQVFALVPSKYGEEPVAKFSLTLSARSRS